MIDEAAKLILQGFYARKRQTGGVTDETIAFEKTGKKWRVYTVDSSLKKALLAISSDSTLLKNGVQYLYEEKLISFKFSGLLSQHFEAYELDVTSKGVRLIEGVVKTEQARIKYENTFNVQIKLAENINVDSFVKAELGATLFKLFSLGE